MQSNNTKPLIAARNLTRIYSLGDSEVAGINHLNFEIAPGELVVLKGESGSGKSTLLSLLAGLDRPTSGELTVADHNLTSASAADLTHFRREVVGMVFQSFNLMPTLNVLENVCLPGLLAGKSFHDIKSRAMDFIDWLGLNTRLSHLPAQLSGGEMQRTAIARALINDPAIVLADEPTGNLDSKTSQEIMALIDQLHNKGQTIIMVTHEPDIAAHCERIIHLTDGKVESDVRQEKAAA